MVVHILYTTIAIATGVVPGVSTNDSGLDLVVSKPKELGRHELELEEIGLGRTTDRRQDQAARRGAARR
jgi:hypothetical protein